MRLLHNILYLTAKEIRSFLRDYALLALVVFMFSSSIYSTAKNITTEMKNAAVAVHDQDRSTLPYRIRDSLRPPQFKSVEDIDEPEIDRAMDTGRYTFILSFPPNYTADLLAGRRPQVQLLVDATAMSQAGKGTGYLQEIIRRENAEYLKDYAPAVLPFEPQINILFNPNLKTEWFMPVSQIVGNAALMAMILAGAAVIRERERGTIEHLLVMPVGAGEIVLAKIAANVLIILTASTLSLYFIVHQAVGAPINGSLALFVACNAVFLSAMAGLGIFLATCAPTMPQFSLLCIIIYIAINLISGSASPLESLPLLMRQISRLSPLTHFTAISQAVVFRGAGWQVIWPHVAATAFSGLAFTALAVARFRQMLARQG